jgi:hypothetical protein
VAEIGTADPLLRLDWHPGEPVAWEPPKPHRHGVGGSWALSRLLIGPPLPPVIWALGALIVVLFAHADGGRGFSLEHLVDEVRRRGLECR